MSFAYFLLVLSLMGCALASRREIEAKPMRLSHLYGAFLAAALVALAPFLFLQLPPGGLVVWGLALAAGAAIGVMRGVMMRIQVDQIGKWIETDCVVSPLDRFIKDTPWAHLDVAGTAMDSSRNDINPSWASGWGVRLLDRLVSEHYE